jgi:hypothetical protein
VVTGHIDKLGRRVESIEEGMRWKTWIFGERDDCRKGLASAILCDMLCDAWECHNTVKDKGGCDNFGNHIIRHDDRRWYGMEKNKSKDSMGVSLVYVPA